MPKITDRAWDQRWNDLLGRIAAKATAFTDDSTERRIARVKRATTDKFFFAASYFPHYIELADEISVLESGKRITIPSKDVWKHPDAEIDWVTAGFGECHLQFWQLIQLRNKFRILAAFRESAKDTLIGKIDALHKLHAKLDPKSPAGGAWYVQVVAETDDVAETKTIPLKLEIESNERLKNDFGDIRGSVKWEMGEFITKDGRKVHALGLDQYPRGLENFGHRGDWIMLNDIEDPLKSFNPALCNLAVDRIKGSILESVNSTRWGGVMLGNYVSKQSILHHLLTDKHTEHFEKVIIRLLVPNEKKTAEEKQVAKDCRKAGFDDNLKSNWEFRHPTLKALRQRKDDPDTFNREKQMMPTDRQGRKYRDTDFKFYHKSDLLNRHLMHWTYIDPSVDDAGDYKAIITIAIPYREEKLQMFLRDAWIRQATIDEMIEETARQHERWHCKVIGLEEIGAFKLLERDYHHYMDKNKLRLPIQPVTNITKSKAARIESLVTTIRPGILLFDLDQGDQELLIEQFKAFPSQTPVSKGGVGDDGPDAAEGCMELTEAFPAGVTADYQTIEKRMASFGKGAY